MAHFTGSHSKNTGILNIRLSWHLVKVILKKLNIVTSLESHYFAQTKVPIEDTMIGKWVSDFVFATC